MDLKFKEVIITSEQEEVTTKRKNKVESTAETTKRLKIDEISGSKANGKCLETCTNIQETVGLCRDRNMQPHTSTSKIIFNNAGCEAKISTSPKKRLELSKPLSKPQTKNEKFIYGNYSQYYGYRNEDKCDIRLDVFAEQREIFRDKNILDIGCNSGFITMEVAKKFEIKTIVGLDIDKSLINQAIKNLTKCKKSLPLDNELKRLQKFPFNIRFVHGNYVLKDDVLLETERAQFDVILCLSITKWIHLNFGDKGLKQAFKRMFIQLKPRGHLILEAQPFDNYSRRKKMTDAIFQNFKDIKFLPKDFTDYLLSSEVGFSSVKLMGVPDHCKKGFKRPIQIFYKD